MFSERLKELRKINNITQVDFAKMFNISSGTIAMWETGKRTPDIETMKKIANHFDVSLDWLTGNSQQKENIVCDGGKPKLKSLSRLENSEFTAEEDEEILSFINYIKSKRNSGD